MRTERIKNAVAVFALVLAPVWAAAQSTTTGAIAGTVKDSSGAVLPGVTVEAASPALIEKVRSAVTDGQGNYRIIELRPGTYTVTFSLPGFGTLKRDGIELTTGVTLNVSGDLKVGSLEETVTVSGAAPVVDIQNTRRVDVISREQLDALPTSKMLHSYAALTLGANMAFQSHQDVGGNQGEAGGFGYFAVHGGRGNDGRMQLDGMHFYALIGAAAAGNRTNYINDMATQETTIETRGMGAEAETGGVNVNIVPKTGGNNYSLSGTLNGTSGRFQSDNLNDTLRSRGLTNTANVKALYDQGVGMGGPLVKDKLWFYTAHRRWGAQNYQPGKFFNLTPDQPRYTPDRSRQMHTWIHNRDHQGRVTWQINERQRLTMSQGFQFDANEFWGSDFPILQSPEATAQLNWNPNALTQVKWNYTPTNQLLLEVGSTSLYETQKNRRNGVVTPAATATPWKELLTQTSWGARAEGLGQTDYGEPSNVSMLTNRYAMSYTTGSHSVKVGGTWLYSWASTWTILNEVPGLGPVRLETLGGVPFQVQQWRTPHEQRNRPLIAGIFAQDQWTLNRVTMNLGVRFDYLNASTPAAKLDAVKIAGQSGDYAPALDLPGVKNVPNWKDITPRIGAAWDVMGNGKTAIKASFGRYNETESNGVAQNNAPANLISTGTNRSWSDADRDFFPDCDLSIRTANGECGALRNPAFGLPVRVNTWDPEVLEGWFVRPYAWQVNVNLQQELRSGMALSAGYYYTTYGNQRATMNRALTNGDYDSYCITAPVDPRLRSAGGKQFCGYVDPRRLPVPDNFITAAKNIGKISDTYNGFEVALQYRFGKGGLLQGGFSSGRQITDSCGLINANLTVAANIGPGRAAAGDVPRSSGNGGFCRESRDLSEQLQVKLQGAYPLPYGFQLSGTVQSLPGIPLYAQIVTPRAVTSTLGRALSTGSANLALFEPWTEFEDRLLQVDMRVSKWFNIGKLRMQGQLDLYNLTNANTVLATQNSFDPATEALLGRFHQPTTILGARLMKFGVQVEW